MNLQELKVHLAQNSDTLIEVLEALGYTKIKNTGKEIRFAKDSNSNATACRVKLTDSLSAVDFSQSIDGSLFDLVAGHKNTTLHEAINLVKKILGIETNNTSFTKTYKPFASVFSNMDKTNADEDVIYEDLIYYPEEELNKFSNELSYTFLKDNISLEAQLSFKIRYDYESDRIIVPWRDENGVIIGFMGRANYSGATNKWIPIYGYSFPKSRTLYGYYENKDYIDDILFIAESEKSVLQAYSMMKIIDGEIHRIRNVVSLGGSIINPYQVELIHRLGVKKIVLAFDEGLDVKKITKELMKLKSKNPFIPIKLGYIYDNDNKYLTKGAKESPYDKGIYTLTGLIKEKIVWIN